MEWVGGKTLFLLVSSLLVVAAGDWLRLAAPCPKLAGHIFAIVLYCYKYNDTFISSHRISMVISITLYMFFSSPCIDDQDIVFVMDRSLAIGQTDLWGAMYAIEILTGAFYKGSSNLRVSVVSYATSLQDISLLDLTPRLCIGREMTFQSCINTLRRYESNIVNTRSFPRTRCTYSGKTFELLKDFIRKDTNTTIITFAGTLSTEPWQNLNNITEGIKQIKEVGADNVQFFAVGFATEHFEFNEERKNLYFAEVKALADENLAQEVVASVKNPAVLLRCVTNMLYDSKVLCQSQSKLVLITELVRCTIYAFHVL